MIRLKTIYKGIKIYLFSVGVIFLILFFTIQNLKLKQENSIIESFNEQLGKEVNTLISVYTTQSMQTITDYTYWDEYINAIEELDINWLKNNITIASSFEYDYVAVFNKSYELVFHQASDEILPKELVSKEALVSLNQTRFTHHFKATQEGLFEFCGGSIHPTSDPGHNKTEPSGYMVIMKKWDKDFLDELATINGSMVSIMNLSDSITDDRRTSIYYRKNLPDYEGKPVSSLLFNRVLDLNFNVTRNMMYLIFLFVLLSLLITNSFSRKYIHQPLKLVTEILRNDSPEAILKLKETPAEYGRIGLLFEEYIEQRNDLKKAKIKAEDSDRLKSAFLANMSHEIRTPMNGILGFMQLLKEPALTDEERQEFIGVIEESGVRMLKIINDIMDMSKIESGQTKTNISETNVNEQLTYIFDFFKPEVEKKGLQLSVNMGLTEGKALINTDREKLYSVLTNLVKNAIKYSLSGSIDFGYAEKPSYLEFYVKDTGIGIPVELQPLVFDRFVQANNKNKSAFQGVGLGLAISKAYLEMLGGKIWLESEPGKGSTFYFTIPYQDKGN